MSERFVSERFETLDKLASCKTPSDEILQKMYETEKGVREYIASREELITYLFLERIKIKKQISGLRKEWIEAESRGDHHKYDCGDLDWHYSLKIRKLERELPALKSSIIELKAEVAEIEKKLKRYYPYAQEEFSAGREVPFHTEQDAYYKLQDFLQQFPKLCISTLTDALSADTQSLVECIADASANTIKTAIESIIETTEQYDVYDIIDALNNQALRSSVTSAVNEI